MTNLAPEPVPTRCRRGDTAAIQSLPAHESRLGEGLTVRRALPHRERRLVGAWCFLDHFGPLDVGGKRGLRVAPHPHIGLQTVTWLLSGEVLHRDSLDNQQVIRPGELNLMTAGRGIAHSEETPQRHSDKLEGLQFWLALPDGVRDCAPAFEHYPSLPTLREGGMTATVVIGEALGERSPAAVHSPLVGLDLALGSEGHHTVTLNPAFEHALLVTQGVVKAGDHAMRPGTLHYLGADRASIELHNEAPARLFLLGGEPFDEAPLLWWNFVARTTEEISTARADWAAGAARFGEVKGYDGDPLEAPELHSRLRPA